MQGVGEFHKVSFGQFLQDAQKTGFMDDDIDTQLIKMAWEGIKLPTRATNGSAGYDFVTPFHFVLKKGKEIIIPTGIRIELEPGWFLSLVPRSGLGFKHGLRLMNTLGIIDSDYFHADNEGHIMAKITVEKDIYLEAGDRFIQGIILPHGTTNSDSTLGLDRKGGFGSTGGN